jgi:hypothetical protein
MTFRTSQFTELCTFCKALAVTSCARCAAPLCAGHEPEVDSRCESCEKDYALALAEFDVEIDERQVVYTVGACGLAAAAFLQSTGTAAFLAAMATISVLALFVLWGSLFADSPVGLLLRRRWRTLRQRQHRRRFLRERVRQALPAATERKQLAA